MKRYNPEKRIFNVFNCAVGGGMKKLILKLQLKYLFNLSLISFSLPI